MQWLIDLVFDAVMAKWKGMIVQWSGAIVDIPDGWHLCDGTEGTPDLRDRFVYGAGGTYNPNVTGGSLTHTHSFDWAGHTHYFDGDGHYHIISSGISIAAGTDFDRETSLSFVTGETEESTGEGTTSTSNNMPPWYALAYIMKL